LKQTEDLLRDVLGYWTPIDAPPKPERSWEGIDGAAISMGGSEVYILSRMDADDSIKPPAPPTAHQEDNHSRNRTPFGASNQRLLSALDWPDERVDHQGESSRRSRRGGSYQEMSVGASAATIVARMLYHLWAGPLLGGPSVVRRSFRMSCLFIINIMCMTRVSMIGCTRRVFASI
jgi:hypothetical protein